MGTDFGARGCRRRGGTRNCSPYRRTIAAAGSRRTPTAPRSSTSVHSAAIRLRASAGVSIAVIPHHFEASPVLVVNLYRRQSRNFCRVIPGSTFGERRSACLIATATRRSRKAPRVPTNSPPPATTVGWRCSAGSWPPVVELANNTPRPGPLTGFST